jgi:hypothetical protein
VFISFFLIKFCIMGGIRYMSFLGEGHEVLDSKELHKRVPVLLGGFVLSLTLILVLFIFPVSSLTNSYIHSFTHSLTCSLFTPLMEIPLHSFFHPFIFLHMCLGSRKEDEMMK